MLFYPLYYDISLTSLKITQVFHLSLGFAKNQITIRILKFKIYSFRITEGLDNRDSDNRGPTVIITVYLKTIQLATMCFTLILLCLYSSMPSGF